VPIVLGNMKYDAFVVWGGNDNLGPRSDVWLYVLPTSDILSNQQLRGWIEVPIRGQPIKFRSAASVVTLGHIIRLGGTERNGVYRRNWSSLSVTSVSNSDSTIYESEDTLTEYSGVGYEV